MTFYAHLMLMLQRTSVLAFHLRQVYIGYCPHFWMAVIPPLAGGGGGPSLNRSGPFCRQILLVLLALIEATTPPGRVRTAPRLLLMANLFRNVRMAVLRKKYVCVFTMLMGIDVRQMQHVSEINK